MGGTDILVCAFHGTDKNVCATLFEIEQSFEGWDFDLVFFGFVVIVMRLTL